MRKQRKSSKTNNQKKREMVPPRNSKRLEFTDEKCVVRDDLQVLGSVSRKSPENDVSSIEGSIETTNF